MQKFLMSLIKLEPRSILKLFLDFSDFEPQYSYKLFSYKKEYNVSLHKVFLKYYICTASLQVNLQ